MKRLVDVRSESLDVQEVERAVAHPAAGAVVSFIGHVRDHNDGKPVARLEYEAYPSMAIKEMSEVVAEIEQRMPGTRLSVVHRTGSLDIGDAAIVCSASAAHRSEAFEACRRLIDAVKSRAPIWKREHGPLGPYWIGWEDARCTGDHEYRPACAHRDGTCHDHDLRSDLAAAVPNPQLLNDRSVVCITVSDTRDFDADESGATAERLLSEAGAHVERHLVHDEAGPIAHLVTQSVGMQPDAVFLTGGTGIGPRDVTVEALTSLLDRQIDGFGEAFRRLSFDEIGPRALLSRAIGGTIGQTLVFGVPGSPKAVTLALQRLIIPLIPHGSSMLKGGGHQA